MQLPKTYSASIPGAGIAAGCKNASVKKHMFLLFAFKNPSSIETLAGKVEIKESSSYAKVSCAHFHPDCYLHDLISELTMSNPSLCCAIFDFCHCTGVTVLPYFLRQCFVGQSVFKKLVILYFICRNWLFFPKVLGDGCLLLGLSLFKIVLESMMLEKQPT